jgi:rhodanese-related sulfurtransferase
MSAPEVDIDEVVAGRAAGVPLVDVRQPEEYDAVHVPGAKLVPLADVVARLGEFPKDQPVHVICQSGQRSLRAAEFLRNQGVDAYSVAGGTKAWVEAGHPTARGPMPG